MALKAASPGVRPCRSSRSSLTLFGSSEKLFRWTRQIYADFAAWQSFGCRFEAGLSFCQHFVRNAGGPSFHGLNNTSINRWASLVFHRTLWKASQSFSWCRQIERSTCCTRTSVQLLRRRRVSNPTQTSKPANLVATPHPTSKPSSS